MSMANICFSCKQAFGNQLPRKVCPSCQESFCSNCLYQRLSVPRLNYQMHEVCSACYHRISTELMLSKPPKNFTKRLEEQQPTPMRMPSAALDPETKALEERLQKLRVDFPATSSVAMVQNTPDELLRQMNDELAIQRTEQDSLATRLRVLHETMPAATPNTVVLPSAAKKSDEPTNDDEEEEFPWCTVCNDNASKRCLDCDELFCESCARKIHRQSAYKRHQLEAYKASAKAKKKFGY